MAEQCGFAVECFDVNNGAHLAGCDRERGHDGPHHPGNNFACDLCWFSFPTVEELNQHVAMENAVNWSIDTLDDEDEPAVSHR